VEGVEQKSFAFVEKKVAVGELDGVGFVMKKICRIHERAFGSPNGGYRGNTTSSKLQSRDMRGARTQLRM